MTSLTLWEHEFLVAPMSEDILLQYHSCFTENFPFSPYPSFERSLTAFTDVQL